MNTKATRRIESGVSSPENICGFCVHLCVFVAPFARLVFRFWDSAFPESDAQPRVSIISPNRIRPLIGLLSGTRIGNCEVGDSAHNRATHNSTARLSKRQPHQPAAFLPARRRTSFQTGGADGAIAS